MLQVISFLPFTTALVFLKIILDSFFLFKFYFSGVMVSLRESKCDFICLEADGAQQGHGKPKPLLN